MNVLEDDATTTILRDDTVEAFHRENDNDGNDNDGDIVKLH